MSNFFEPGGLFWVLGLSARHYFYFIGVTLIYIFILFLNDLLKKKRNKFVFKFFIACLISHVAILLTYFIYVCIFFKFESMPHDGKILRFFSKEVIVMSWLAHSGMFLTVLVFKQITGLSFKNLGLTGKISIDFRVVKFLIFIIIFGLLYCRLIDKFFIDASVRPSKFIDGMSSVPVIISIIIMKPFIEEFYFRGVLLKCLDISIPIGWLVFFQSVYYAASNFDLYHFAYYMLFGFVAGNLFVKYGRVWPSFYIHAINNFLGMLLLGYIAVS